MGNLNSGELRGWLTLGVFLLVQTATVAGFIMTLSTRVTYHGEQIAENRAAVEALNVNGSQKLNLIDYKMTVQEARMLELLTTMQKHMEQERK